MLCFAVSSAWRWQVSECSIRAARFVMRALVPTAVSPSCRSMSASTACICCVICSCLSETAASCPCNALTSLVIFWLCSATAISVRLDSVATSISSSASLSFVPAIAATSSLRAAIAISVAPWDCVTST